MFVILGLKGLIERSHSEGGMGVISPLLSLLTWIVAQG